MSNLIDIFKTRVSYYVVYVMKKCDTEVKK